MLEGRDREEDVVTRAHDTEIEQAWIAGTKPPLGLALAKRGRLDEAAGTALEAVTSGYLVPSNFWRAGEIVEAVCRRDVPESRDLEEAYRAEVTAAHEPAGTPPAALP